MEFFSKLCHFDPDSSVVLVSALKDGRKIGSALGQGSTCEEAEDRAIRRILNRLEDANSDDLVYENPDKDLQTSNLSTYNQSKKSKDPNIKQQNNISNDPLDWGEELSEIELHLKRIQWDRESEKIYLNRVFNINSRLRLTTYFQIQKYLGLLKNLDTNSSPNEASIYLTRDQLIKEGDSIIAKSNINNEQARKLLEEEMNVQSRNKLTIELLTRFNDLLHQKSLEDRA